MSKLAIGCELLTKTPTVKVEPTENGPRLGGLLSQFVAVVDAVMQTSPVPE